MSEHPPPQCFICGKKCDISNEDAFYCICDIAICNDCINSIKKNDNTWVCPHCKEENSIEESKLFRTV